MHTPTERSRRRARRGTTLMELMVVMVILAIIMAGAFAALNRQQVATTGQTATTELRAQLNEAARILPVELRSVSSVGSDIIGPLYADSLKLRVTYGTAVICQVVGSAVDLVPAGRLSPLDATKNYTLSSFVYDPQPGDWAFVLNEGATAATIDDSWTPMTIANSGSGGASGARKNATSTCLPALGGYTTAADANKSNYTLNLNGSGGSSMPATAGAGTPIKLAREVGYTWVQRNGDWYLGYCSSGYCGLANTPEPLVGPLWHAMNGSAVVPVFTYYDAAGAQIPAGTAATTGVARIVVTLRARTKGVVSAAGARTARDYVTDSLQVSIAIRNRNAT